MEEHGLFPLLKLRVEVSGFSSVFSSGLRVQEFEFIVFG